MAESQRSRYSSASFAGGMIVFLTGLYCLFLSLPLSDPWRMHHVQVLYWTIPHLVLRLPFTSATLTLPMVPFLALIGLIILVPLFLTKGGRGFVSFFAQSGLSLPLVFAWLIIFVFTVLPGLWVGGIYSRPVAVYLMLGLFGFILTFSGVAMVWTVFGGWKRELEWWTRSYEPLRRRVFGMERKYFLGGIFLLHCCLANMISYYCFEHIPHVQDSIAQLFHAKIFAQGNLVAISHPAREFFDFTHMINNGQWYSQYPPGHSVLLAVGVLAGVPWIVNPLLGSATVVLFYFLGKELYGESVGRISALLGLLSPLILFMSSEFMNHASSLFFVTLFLLFSARFLKSGQKLDGLIAGGAIGWVFLIRPLTAVGAGLPLLLYGVVELMKRRRELGPGAATMAGAASVFFIMMLTFNYFTNGDPLLFGFQVLYGDDVLPGFGNSAWGEAHSLLRGIYQTLDNLLGMNKYLFEWPIPSLILVMVLFVSQNVNRWDFLLLGSGVTLAVAYLFYWYQDWCFGPRFLYEAAAPLILLTARGIERVPHLARKCSSASISVRTLTALTALALAILTTISLVFNLPPLVEDYADRYWGVDGKGGKVVEQAGLKNAIVFTKGNYGGVFTRNRPDLSNDVLFVRDRGHRNGQLMEYFPGYTSYLLRNDSLHQYTPPQQPASAPAHSGNVAEPLVNGR